MKPDELNPAVIEAIEQDIRDNAAAPYERQRLVWRAKQAGFYDLGAISADKRAFCGLAVAWLRSVPALDEKEQFFLDYFNAFAELLDCRDDICTARKDKFARLWHDSWITAYPKRGTKWLESNTPQS